MAIDFGSYVALALGLLIAGWPAASDAAPYDQTDEIPMAPRND